MLLPGNERRQGNKLVVLMRGKVNPTALVKLCLFLVLKCVLKLLVFADFK